MTSNKGGKRKNTPKEGLFDDLQDLSETEISEKISAMKAGIDARDWNKAADEMVDSRWYRQVTKRADRLVERMRNV